MKKIIVCLLVIVSIALPFISAAETYYAQNGAGAMSTREWDTAAGGGGTDLVWANRQAGDVFIANGQTAIAIDTDPGVGASQVTLSTATSGGGFTLAAGIPITAHIIAGTTTCVLTSGAGTVTVTGNITGGATASTNALEVGAQSIIVNGNITGGSSSTGHGLRKTSSTGSVTVTGNITGGTAGVGFFNVAAAAFTVNGNIAGGAGTDPLYGQGIKNSSTGTGTITGNVSGGAGEGSGILNDSTGSITIIGNLIFTATGSPLMGGYYTYTPAANQYIQIGGTNYPVQLAAGNIKSGVVSGSTTGTYTAAGGGGAWAH